MSLLTCTPLPPATLPVPQRATHTYPSRQTPPTYAPRVAPPLPSQAASCPAQKRSGNSFRRRHVALSSAGLDGAVAELAAEQAPVPAEEIGGGSKARRVPVGEEELAKRGGVLQSVLGGGVSRDVVESLNAALPRHIFAANLEECSDFLSREVGLAPPPLAKVLKKVPRLVGHDVATQLRPVVDFLLKEAGLSKGGVERLVRRAPQVLAASLEGRIKPQVQYLLELGLTHKQLERVLTLGPEVLLCSRASCVPKVRFFETLGVPRPAIAKLVHRCPLIISHYSVENNLAPSVQFLLEAGIQQEEIAKHFVRHPEILISNPETNLLPKLALLGKYGIPSGDGAAMQVLMWKPRLSVGTIEKKLIELEGMGFAREEVCKILLRCPQILGYRQEVTRAKLDYLLNVMKKPRKEILHWPKVLEYSLEGRIIPRHRHLGDLAASISLASMMVCTDEYFHKRWGGARLDVDELEVDKLDVPALDLAEE